MLIPKDATLFIPTWAIHHSSNIYSDPETFNPDRYHHHEKLANDYAGSSDWPAEITTTMELVGGFVRAFMWQKETCGALLQSYFGLLNLLSQLIRTLAWLSPWTLTRTILAYCKRL